MSASNSTSAILTAMYNRQRDEAMRLAAAAPTLTVWEASALGDNDRLRELLDRDGTLANAYAPDGFLPLSLAAFFAPAATTQLLLERGATVGTAARNGMKVQALHAAVSARNADATRMLLDQGADPNSRQQVGYTPLMGAAAAGQGDLIDLLLQRGADPTLVSDDGKTAADVAREHGHTDLVERLIARI